MARCWRVNQRGSSLVEFIIIMPALFMLLFGVMEVSRLWLTIGVVAEAAREAARTAALQPLPFNSSPAVAKANAVLATANLTSASGYPTVTCSSPCLAGQGSSAPTVTATVRVPFNTAVPLLLPWFGGDGGLTITQVAQMRYEP